MKFIPLANWQQMATIDDSNFSLVSRFTWYLADNNGTAVAFINGRRVEMGELILFPDIAEGAN